MKKIAQNFTIVFIGLALLSLTACGSKTITKEFPVPAPVASQQQMK